LQKESDENGLQGSAPKEAGREERRFIRKKGHPRKVLRGGVAQRVILAGDVGLPQPGAFLAGEKEKFTFVLGRGNYSEGTSPC